MRALTFLLTALLIAGVAFVAGPGHADACSCASLPSDRAGAEKALAQLKEYDAVTLVGVVEQTTGSDSEPGAVIRTERVYGGQMPERFAVTSSNCNGIVVPFEKGQRLVLDVTRRDGSYRADGCSAGVVDGISTNSFRDGDDWASALDGLESFSPADRGAGSGLEITVVVLTVVSLAALVLVGVYVARRRET